MQTQEITEALKAATQPLKITLPALAYAPQTIPGAAGKAGAAYVAASDLPPELEAWLHVNPRLPRASGPIVAGIRATLREHPEQMAIKNRGITLLAASVEQTRYGLEIQLTDPAKHGIVDGGHTFAAIRQALDEGESIKGAFVKLHIIEGADSSLVPSMAAGLNRSRQVDDPSLANLQGQFEPIRAALAGLPVSYHQGDSGGIYISEVLVCLEMFNERRWSGNKHPSSLYNRQSLGLRYFAEDMERDNAHMLELISLLPDILRLSAKIKAAMLAKVKKAPKGWLYPVLAAFRANLAVSGWAIPLDELLPKVIDSLIRVCVWEEREGTRPERLGKKESVYEQCYTKVQLHLATTLFHKATR